MTLRFFISFISHVKTINRKKLGSMKTNKNTWLSPGLLHVSCIVMFMWVLLYKTESLDIRYLGFRYYVDFKV